MCVTVNTLCFNTLFDGTVQYLVVKLAGFGHSCGANPSISTDPKKNSKKIRQQIYPICKRHLPLSQGKLCVTLSKQSLRLDFCFSCSLESFGSMKTMKIPKFGANENDSTTNLFVKSRKSCGSFFIVVLVLTFSRLQFPEMFDASTSPSWSTLKITTTNLNHQNHHRWDTFSQPNWYDLWQKPHHALVQISEPRHFCAKDCQPRTIELHDATCIHANLQ